MTILSKKLWVGLLTLAAIALVSGATVVGGIEWALASLGALVLIGMIGIGVYVLTKVLRYSSRSFPDGYLEYGNMSTTSSGGDNKPVKVTPISQKDKKLIMKHIDELFTKDLQQGQERPAKGAPISREDKRLIMAHIDQLFETGWEQSQSKLS